MKRFFFYFFISLFFYLFISSFIHPIQACSWGPYGCTGACSTGYSCQTYGYGACSCDPIVTTAPTAVPTSGDSCPAPSCGPLDITCTGGSFAVCTQDSDCQNDRWGCTGTTGSCTSWSNWSECYPAPDCVQTKYCTNGSAQPQAQSCTDGAGCGSGPEATATPVPVNPPICSGSCAPQSATTTATTGTFYAYAYGVSNATMVKFPTWTSANLSGNPAYDVSGQDDIVWYNSTNLGGGTWQAAINLASHPGTGPINVHVYMDNTGYTNQWCCTANFTRVVPVNGVCSNPDTHYTCSAGVLGSKSDTSSQWRWYCDGTNGGSNSPLCVENKPINGVCSNPDTHYTCSAGTSASNASGASTWTWGCNGLYGGTSTSATACSENKPTTPVGTCGSFNPLTCTTPVTWTWANGTRLQATFDYAPATNPLAQYWLFNGPTTSPKIFNNISTGHIAYGRTTYDSSYFSSTANRTCAIPTLSIPTLVCGSFNEAGVYTPVTATWGVNGNALQVTRDLPPATQTDSSKWLYNGTAASGIVITPPAGKYMPPGDPIYARTYYSCAGSTFSATSTITCPLPTNPSPVTVSGPLQQKSGTGCYPATASSNFNAQNPTVTTNPSSCVATACTVSPSTSAAQTYTCTTTFSNQNCLNNNPPTWPTSATLTLTGIAPSGYTFVGWTPNGVCTPATNSKAVNDGDTIANQPITFNFSGSNWIKLKDSSFNGISITGVTVPAFVTSYDADDNGSKYFIIGNSGAILNQTINPSTAYSSPNNWHASYTKSSSMNPTTFLSYVKSRKQYQTVSDMSSINQDGIYFWQGALTLNNTNLNQATASKFVLIVDGNVTINQDKFNIGNCTDASGLKKIAILSKTGTITFSNTTQCAAGIFIAQTIDTGSTGAQGLKIKGNLIAQTTLTNGRAWSDTSRPGLFVVFDPVQYTNLLPYLSTASYEWRQIQ